MLRLSNSRYGESGVRLMKITRRGDRHEVRELTVAIDFEGDFDAAHVIGDSRSILPAGTVQNTVFALAGRHGGGEIEEFALALTQHFILEHEPISAVSVSVSEQSWNRVQIGGRPRNYAFSRSGDEKRVTSVRRTRGDVTVDAGIADLRILESNPSRADNHLRGRYTTAAETAERLVSTVLNVQWRYGWIEIPFGVHWRQVHELLLSTFAEHEGQSVQHMLYAMAQTVLEQCPPVAEIHFRLPSHSYPLADLSGFGLDNDNEVFIATHEPFDVIEATVRREEIG